MTKHRPSLKRPLIVQPLIFHLLALLVAFFVLLWFLARVDSGGYYTDQAFSKIAAKAITQGPDGRLAVRMTPDLAKILRRAPAAWFVAEDEQGHHISFGSVPEQYSSFIGQLGGLTYGDIRGSVASNRLSVIVRREPGPNGDLTILGYGKTNALTSLAVALATNIIVIPIFALLALVTLILTPLIVNRSLAGVARIADEANKVGFDRRGIRLTETEVPKEIAPLVRAVNDALVRLDEGHERQRRFIASAAHELRTPIAILSVKIDTAEDGAVRRLAGDVARLSTLAEQLLDLDRLNNSGPKDRMDLASLVRRVVADLAPLLITEGKEIEVLVESSEYVDADAGAIERVVSNLVQNASEHGGRHVVVRVIESSFEVQDDGPGIPAKDRERVFEPFHRLRPRQSGAGLGLNLTQQVVEGHGGRITILDAPEGGALVRVVLPKA